MPKVAVALRGRGLGRVARHRGRARRHDDGRLGVAVRDRPVHVLAVVGAVAGERGDRVGALRGRTRRIAIVAMARKLLIVLWRYAETGLVPEGVEVAA